MEGLFLKMINTTTERVKRTRWEVAEGIQVHMYNDFFRPCLKYAYSMR